MDVFDYIKKELDRIEVGYTSYDGTKITLTMDEVRELIRNLRKKYQPDGDVIYRQAAIDALDKRFDSIPIEQTAEVLQLRRDLRELPSAQPETNCSEIPNNWIPCSERLPEEDVEVLISYRYKEGEGDTSHIDMDITTYGQMYFGGNKVGNRKHWRAPFEYFESNYEVVAWMPLPEPYKERREDDNQ